MDSRRPVPLLPMMALHQKEQMRRHLVVIEQVMDGLAREDWAALEAASARLGTSPHMAQTCEHMGALADGFTPRALDMHRRADAITAAAQAKDGPGVLRATHSTPQACNGCHEAWRQEVLNDAEYARKAGAEPAGHGG